MHVLLQLIVGKIKMEFHFLDLMKQFQPISMFALLLASIFLYKLCNYRNRNTKNDKRRAPQASGGRPIMGHFHLFNGTELAHRTLSSMADKYGPVFSIQYGSHKTLVVRGSEIIKECFTTSDRFISNRSGSLGLKLMFYGVEAVGYAPYGPYWRELRKISTIKLLSNHRLETLKHLRNCEVESCFKQLMNCWVQNRKGDSDFVLVRMDDWFGDLTLNVMARTVTGKKNFVGAAARGDAGAQRYKSVITEAMRLMTVFAFSDVIPFLSWLDNVRGLVRDMKRCQSEIDSVVGNWIDEHRSKRKNVKEGRGSEVDDDIEQDFIDDCLDIMEHSSMPFDDPETVTKSTCLDMIMGASDGPAAALTWVLSLVLNHPQVLKRAKEELDNQVGKERQVEDSDMPNLPFIQAIIKETMRLYPASPLMERRTTDDCKIGGFHVPAGTHLLVNVWETQRDKEVWKEEPLEFRPERFLSNTTEVDLKGQHYELIPFGAGRRICPGVSYSLQLMHLVLARLLHGFEIRTPVGVKVDMTESPGFISHKLTPLEVLIRPRYPNT